VLSYSKTPQSCAESHWTSIISPVCRSLCDRSVPAQKTIPATHATRAILFGIGKHNSSSSGPNGLASVLLWFQGSVGCILTRDSFRGFGIGLRTQSENVLFL